MQEYPRVGVGVVIFNDNNEILLGRRTSGLGIDTWGNPGGHLEFKETFEACAIREVEEETGLHIDPASLKLLGLYTVIDEAKNKHYVSIMMRATFPKDQVVLNKEPDKTIEWLWYNIYNLPENLFLPMKKVQEQYGWK